jgi:AcrR family transcriptional regulator
VPSASVEPEKPSGPRSRKGERTRARLLDAAKEVFEESGFLEARISDIAERAGLSHGSFYHYFDSKEQIFREVAESLDEVLSAPMTEVVLATGSTVPPQERIREALRHHFESYRKEARIMGVIEQVSRYDDHVNALRLARHQQYSKQIADSIRQLQLRKLADPELDPALTAAALGALTYRFAEMWLVQGAVDCSLEEGIDQVARIFVNALGLQERAAAKPRKRAAS